MHVFLISWLNNELFYWHSFESFVRFFDCFLLDGELFFWDSIDMGKVTW